MTVFCEECKHLPNCELTKHEEVDTCKKGEKIDYDLVEEFSQAFSSCNECEEKDNSV